jgi:hypothetical protein
MRSRGLLLVVQATEALTGLRVEHVVLALAYVDVQGVADTRGTRPSKRMIICFSVSWPGRSP